MEDAILSGSGNSRLLRIPQNAQINTVADLVVLLKGDGLPVDVLTNKTGGGFINPDTMTPQNGNTFFTDATAAAYSLTGADAVPNSAFRDLAFATQYTWVRTPNPLLSFLYGSPIETTVSNGNGANTTVTIYYTDELIINQETGSISPGAVSSLVVSYNSYTAANTLRGKYWATNQAALTGLPANINNLSSIKYTSLDAAVATRYTNNTNVFTVYIFAGPIFTTSSQNQPSEVLFSTDINAYPHADTGGFSYQFVGKFSDLPLFADNSVTGMYAGSGAVKNLLVFPFTPKFLVIYDNQGAYGRLGTWVGASPSILIKTYNSFGASSVALSGQTLTITGTTVDTALNNTSYKYYYCAIG